MYENISSVKAVKFCLAVKRGGKEGTLNWQRASGKSGSNTRGRPSTTCRRRNQIRSPREPEMRGICTPRRRRGRSSCPRARTRSSDGRASGGMARPAVGEQGGGSTATSIGRPSRRRREQWAARVARLVGVARGWVVKYAGKSKTSTGRDQRDNSSISGHQHATEARSESPRSGGTDASSMKRRRWTRRASGASVESVKWSLGGKAAWSKASQKLVRTSRERSARVACVRSARTARAGVQESTERGLRSDSRYRVRSLPAGRCGKNASAEAGEARTRRFRREGKSVVLEPAETNASARSATFIQSSCTRKSSRFGKPAMDASVRGIRWEPPHR
ncbi:hypothetical protein EDB89DRAFT_224338 [Lactarius sanguifluus]|nr:hypothetical protein EDB89DRAFT_224338 [Lactarius sanguifluus]